jgi:hypothetical protein
MNRSCRLNSPAPGRAAAVSACVDLAPREEAAESGAPHGASGRRGTGDAPGRLRREGRRSRTLCEARAGRGPNFPAPSRASHPCRGA